MRTIVKNLVLASVTALSLLASPLTSTAKADDTAADTSEAARVRQETLLRRARREEARKAKEAKEAAEAAGAPPVATAQATTPAPVESPATANAAPQATVPQAATPPAGSTPLTTATTPANATTPSTPLNIVPSKPLTLSAPPSTSDMAWKLGVLGLAAAAGVWVWKKKRTVQLDTTVVPELRVMKRTALGGKNELVLIELEGQRLLLGLTPTSVTSLLIYPDSGMSDPVEVEEPVVETKAASLMRAIAAETERPSRREAREPRERRDSNRHGKTRDIIRDVVGVSIVPVNSESRELRGRGDREIMDSTPSPALARIEGQAEGLRRLRSRT